MWHNAGARFDLVETRIAVFDPRLNLIDFTGIDSSGALGSRYDIAWLCCGRPANRMFPVMPVPVQRVIHRFGFDNSNTAAPKRIVKHAIDLLPRSRLLVVSDIVKN